MESWKETVQQYDDKYHLGIGKMMGWEDNTSKEKDASEPLHSVFKLPIMYLPEEAVRPLSTLVSTDLEMVANQGTVVDKDTPEKRGMYDYLLQPQHDFAKTLISDWNQNFTTDTEFLSHTQDVLHKMPQYLEGMKPTKVDSAQADEPYRFTQDKCEKIMEIWKDTKEDPDFLEKYCYIEWDMVKYLNKSPYFLQSLSIINMTAPIMSFIIPIIFLIFPFIILKIQNVPINFQMYVQVLKDIARHHFIGKTISSLQSLSWDKIVYMLITVGLYFLQIYQNINLCCRFYRNIHRINSHLTELRDYLEYSIQSMENFMKISGNLPSYKDFTRITRNHCLSLQAFYDELVPIRPFEPGFFKLTEIGYLLKCFYELHSHPGYEESIRYSMGFEGYVNNLLGIHDNMAHRRIAMANIHSEPCSTCVRKQYYPAHVDKEHVKNTFDLSNNAIITGPNASGKTTMLKATTINVIFTQQFGVGFYESCDMAPYTHIHSYLNIPDTSGRDSLFQAESRRCKEIIDIIHKPYPDTHENRLAKHFCIFDELYSGTNPTEATQSAYAFLLYLSKYKNVDFILTTHYVSLCKKLEKKLEKKAALRKIANYKMDVTKNPETGKVKYTYLMKRGISKIQGAVLILEEMCYPKEILDEMHKKST
jgi:hypothetical protein